jgi:galactoside O-acetyltransferase
MSSEQLNDLNFAKLGRGVKISDRASIYNPEMIQVGDFSRIDDYCVLSGQIVIGRNVHIAVFCNVAGGAPGVFMEDFSGLAYGCQVFAQSDDYSGLTMTNPTVPAPFKNEYKAKVRIGRHCILGTNSVVMPGIEMADGSATGAMSLVTESTEEWKIYVGSPARYVRERSRDLLALEQKYLASGSE